GMIRHFSMWVVEENLPWTTGEAPGLQRLWRYLRIDHPLPTDTTVRKTLRGLYLDMQDTQMVFSFAGTLAFYISKDWVCVKRLVDFRHLQIGDHTGVGGAKAFVDLACKRGGLKKMSS
ncbi:hypothetical protein BDV93DRAFT_447587, partial [Ceratobasidium sp. AG-I]